MHASGTKKMGYYVILDPKWFIFDLFLSINSLPITNKSIDNQKATAMKRNVCLVFVMLLLISTVQSQEVQPLTSKKGIPILPQAGEFAIGINAVPIFGYFGNMFNNTVNNNIGFNFVDANNFIFGKYFAEDLLAYRVGLRIGHSNLSNVRYIPNDLEIKEFVTDKHQISRTNVILGIGMEKRKGVHRIQGSYGLDLMLGLQSGTDKFTYGNEITGTNTNPGTTDFGNNLLFGARATQIKNGLGIMVGARGFVGVEVFVLPKLSVGGEFGWGPQIGFRTKSNHTGEFWNFVDQKVESLEIPNDKGSLINLDTDNAGGIIKFMFHF